MTRLTKSFDHKQYDAYITKQVRAMTRAREKGHRDFQWTDEEIQDAAQTLARLGNAGEVWR